jgi:hypothetical protein
MTKRFSTTLRAITGISARASRTNGGRPVNAIACNVVHG